MTDAEGHDVANQATAGIEALEVALGRVAIAWGIMHDEIAHLFSAVLFNQMDEVALACWYAHKSDYAQRDMLIAASGVALATREDLNDRIVNLMKEVHKMSQVRNELVHASYSIVATSHGQQLAVPHTSYGSKIAAVLANRFPEGTLVKESLHFATELDRVTLECGELYQCVLDPERAPLPRKFRWRTKASTDSHTGSRSQSIGK